MGPPSLLESDWGESDTDVIGSLIDIILVFIGRKDNDMCGRDKRVRINAT